MTHPTSQPASLFSKPKSSFKAESMAADAASLLSITGPHAAICSYSGSSTSIPAYGPSVIVIMVLWLAGHPQQGLRLG